MKKGCGFFESNAGVDFPNYTKLKAKIQNGEVEIITCMAMARAMSTVTLRFLGAAERVDSIYNYPFDVLGKIKTGAYNDDSAFNHRESIERGCKNILEFLKKNNIANSKKPYTLAVKVVSNFLSEKTLRAIFAISAKCIFIIRDPKHQIRSFTYCMLHELLTPDSADFSIEQANEILAKTKPTEKEKSALQEIEKQIGFQWENMKYYHEMTRQDYPEKLLTLDGEIVRNEPNRVIASLNQQFPELGCGETMAADLSSTQDYLCAVTSHRPGGLDKWNQIVRTNDCIQPAEEVSAIEGKNMLLTNRLASLAEKYAGYYDQLQGFSITNQVDTVKLIS